MAIVLKRDEVIVKQNKPIGIRFPLAQDPNSFFGMNYTTSGQLADNVFAFFNTKKGSRLFRSDYGTALWSLVFEPTPSNVLDLEVIIKEEFRKYLPYAVYETSEFYTDDRQTELLGIKIQWHITGDTKVQNTFIDIK